MFLRGFQWVLKAEGVGREPEGFALDDVDGVKGVALGEGLAMVLAKGLGLGIGLVLAKGCAVG